MKTKAENKNKRQWRYIKININGQTIVHELDENQRLKTRFPRQPARNLSEEMLKISSGHCDKSQSITSNTLPSTNANMMMPFSHAYTQGTNLVNNIYQPPPTSNSNPTLPSTNTNMMMPFSHAYTQGTNLVNSIYQPPPTSNSNPTLLYNQTNNQAYYQTNIDTNSNSNLKSETEQNEQDDTTISNEEETFNVIDLNCNSENDIFSEQDNLHFFDDFDDFNGFDF